LGICEQSDVLTDTGENWTEKCFLIVSVRPANRCSESCHQQPNEPVIKRNPTPITAALTSVIITREFHFQTGSSPAPSRRWCCPCTQNAEFLCFFLMTADLIKI
jgi:hypothetical protein